MARINDLMGYNSGRYEPFSLKNGSDETILLTSEELKSMMLEFLTTEMDFFSDEIYKKDKTKLLERLNFKLKHLENEMIRHIDDKINGITEKIVLNMTNRIVEEEVKRRVDEKLNKIKNLL